MADSVTYIGIEAFTRCEALTSIKLSNALKDISGGAFEGCKSLTNITLPASVETMGLTSFRSCKKLTYISVPDDLHEIEDSTFKSCSSKLVFYGNNNPYVSNYADENDFGYKKLKLNKTKESISVGETLKLYMNSRANCIWKSSNKNIASVSSSGKVTAKSKGKVKIIAVLYGYKYKCTITVK